MNKYNIGDEVYYATHESKQIWVECPECIGSGRLKVTLGTGEELHINCQCCERGYEGSPGKIYTWEPKAKVELITISRMEINPDRITYGGHSSYILNEDRLFKTKKEAEEKAKKLTEEYKIGLEKDLHRKEKDSKSWAWHVHYHRREIKSAEKQIEYHKSKLAIASKR